jgi:hypothetical protein
MLNPGQPFILILASFMTLLIAFSNSDFEFLSLLIIIELTSISLLHFGHFNLLVVPILQTILY